MNLKGLTIMNLTFIGTKATNLELMRELGLLVPAMYIVPSDAANIDIHDLWAWIAANVRAINGQWKLAVRSSSLQEDTALESKAGHFLSLVDSFDRQSLLEAINRVRQSGPDMAVIVQRLIDPSYAGVFFSCDPLTFERCTATIAWTEGLADRLLTGSETGHHVRIDNLGRVSDGMWPGTQKALDELRQAGKALEQQFKRPVDIEWAIDESGQLWFLQARPVVLPKSGQVILSNQSNFENLPSTIRQHHKIKLRREAALLDITMAPAVVTTCSGDTTGLSLGQVQPSLGAAAAASVVLVYPEHINCAVVREFAPLKRGGIQALTEKCRRYAVRRYPSVDGIETAKRAVLQAGLGQSWTATTIVQAVWDALATGIIRRSANGYIIDIAQGHFVPKGVVTTSTIVVATDRSIIHAQWRHQATAYHFVNGHVVTETPPKQQLQLEDLEIARIADTMDPLFDIYQDAALEFGILENDGCKEVYLIDVAEGDAGSIRLDRSMVRSGVLSTGMCRGRVLRVENANLSALDNHLHDRRTADKSRMDAVIVVANQASTDLLEFACAEGVMGFVFCRASILAHLPVVLREKGIPAIVLEDAALHKSLVNGTLIEVDASSDHPNAFDRIRFLNGDRN